MSIAANWEYKLIQKATIAPTHNFATPLIHYGDDTLGRAYNHCAKITKEHSKTFYLTSGLLGGESAKAARALYAFCRVSDDLIDQNTHQNLRQLEHRLDIWKRRSLLDDPLPDDLVPLAWAHARVKFGIPIDYAEQLLDGVAQDLFQARYQTFDELAHYCYGVASTVGLMIMYMIGHNGSKAIPYAIRMGVALQLTNILRDVGEDWENGRIYLPQEELDAFGLSEADIARGQVTEKWRDFMRFQINRTRQIYQEAMPGISLLDYKGRFAIKASAELYQAILAKIEQNDYDVFKRRAYLSNTEKFSRLPGIWWQTLRYY
jgi:phytoene synthase